MILQWFKRRAELARRAEELYGGVVAAARQPRFYRDMGVRDTPEGRFELVALHLFLALERMKRRGAEDRDAISQRAIEAFVADMDDCMREMGVGDLAVPGRVKRAAAAFYERTRVYRAALREADDDVLLSALIRHVFDGRDTGAGATMLLTYVRSAVSAASVDVTVDPPNTALGAIGS